MSNRTPMPAGNWKMNLGKADALAMLEDLKARVAGTDGRDIVVAPMAPLLPLVIEATKGSNIKVAAQNCHQELKGAFTGEWPPELLAELGCAYVIIGHSERRAIFGESDELIAEKAVAVFRAGLIPIVCIGETLEEREADETLNVVTRQLSVVLDAVKDLDPAKMVIAYEPVWAIGTGKTASPQQAEDVHEAIRGILAKAYDQDTADKIRILYGGSVKPDNVDELMAKPNIDGSLVGGASLKAESFARIVNFQ